MELRLANAQALYLEAIRDGKAAEAIEKYSGERYIQHSTPVRDGRDGFVEFFEDFIQRNPVREVDIVRGFVDGRYVFLHVVQNLNGGEFRYVTADIFDTDENGKMVEHWDMITEMVDDAVSGRSQVDGPTVPINIDQTEQNKKLVQRFVDEVLVGGVIDRSNEFVSTEILHHGPGLGARFQGFAANNQPVHYDKVHLVIGCGDFVAVMSQIRVGGVASAVIDLFRVAAGLIVEHWDVSEEITPAANWVNSGKF